MPVANYRHDLKTASGKPVFIIRTPVRITRRMLGKQFVEGECTTTNEQLAMRFAEEFGYEVILPKGHKGFKFAEAPAAERGQEYQEQASLIIEDDEEEIVSDE